MSKAESEDDLGEAEPEGEELLAKANEIADAEADDLDALVTSLSTARNALADAYNRLARSTEPIICVVQGRVETAQETVDAALDIVESMKVLRK